MKRPIAALLLMFPLWPGPAIPTIGLTAVLASCSSTSTTDIAQAKADAQAIIGTVSPPTGLNGTYGALKMLYPKAFSPAVDAQVHALLDAAPGLIDQISATADAATNASGLRGIEADASGVLNLIAAALANVPNVPAQYTLALAAVETLLPIIEASANQLVPQAAKVGAGPVRFRSGMTKEQARAVLR